jgi:hypothetical protein
LRAGHTSSGEVIRADSVTEPTGRSRGQARERLPDCRRLLQRQVSQARELLREILVALIRFTRFVIGARRGYRFEGDASIGGLLRGVIELPADATSNGVPGGRVPGLHGSLDDTDGEFVYLCYVSSNSPR